jgi:hypothetical protein
LLIVEVGVVEGDMTDVSLVAVQARRQALEVVLVQMLASKVALSLCEFVRLVQLLLLVM